MPGAEGGCRGCPRGPHTLYEENIPSESSKHQPQLRGDGPPGQAATEQRQPEMGVPSIGHPSSGRAASPALPRWPYPE